MLCADYVSIDIAWAVFAKNRNARSRVDFMEGDTCLYMFFFQLSLMREEKP